MLAVLFRRWGYMMVNEPLTLFTWGYYGWGNSTAQLVKAVDAVEHSREFRQPMFVDIRIRRAGRATGFNGSAFEDLLGSGRYQWMKSLGNKFIVSKSGPKLQIAEPDTAHALLDLAIAAHAENRRVLFFCSCGWWNARHCHRNAVAHLLLKAAKQRRIAIQISEWPGGDPQNVQLEVSPVIFMSIRKGRMTIPLDKRVDLPWMAGLPWCSIATLHSRGDEIRRVVGPVSYGKG